MPGQRRQLDKETKGLLSQQIGCLRRNGGRPVIISARVLGMAPTIARVSWGMSEFGGAFLRDQSGRGRMRCQGETMVVPGIRG